MEHYKAICLDLDGTMYRGTEPIAEAVQFVSERQAEGIGVYFITNNSSLTQAAQQKKLREFGVETETERIMTSAIAIAKYCKQHYEGATAMMIGEDGLQEALAKEGIQLTTECPDLVLMGIDRSVTYQKLSEACLSIRNGAIFLGTNQDLAFPTERGLVPGNGSFLRLMESATGTKPIVVGKPEPHMLELIRKEGGYAKEEMLLIGDNYDTDIMAGIRYGIDTVHVATGVTPAEDVLARPIQPTFCLSTLADWNKKQARFS